MRLDLHKYDGGGNPTVLVDNRAGKLAADRYPRVAGRILADQALGEVEQVAFIERPILEDTDGRMVMMGGELCVNALRCYGALLAPEASPPAALSIETSGAPAPLRVRVRRGDAGGTLSEACLECTPEAEEADGLFRVDLPGIRHYVVPAQAPLDAAGLRGHLARVMGPRERQIGAVGIIALYPVGPDHGISPLIYVAATDTHIMETACGSGSLAAHIVLARTRGVATSRLLQPSGHYLDVRCEDPHHHIIDGPAFAEFSGEIEIAETPAHAKP